MPRDESQHFGTHHLLCQSHEVRVPESIASLSSMSLSPFLRLQATYVDCTLSGQSVSRLSILGQSLPARMGYSLVNEQSIVLPHITHGSCARQRASSGSRGRDTCGNTGCCRARSHLVCVACVSDGAHLSRTPHALGRRARACGEPSGWFPNRPIRSSRRVAVSKSKPQFSHPNGTTCMSCLGVHTRLKTCRIRGMLLRDNATIATTNVPPRRLNPSA